jgi:hypothetical protein
VLENKELCKIFERGKGKRKVGKKLYSVFEKIHVCRLLLDNQIKRRGVKWPEVGHPDIN